MIFMFLFFSDEKVLASMSRDERNGLVERHVAYNHEVLEKRATVLATRGLQPTPTAHTVRPQNGEMTARSGPFSAADEALAGFYLVECRDLDEALELAKLYPMPEGAGCIEVRPVMTDWEYAPSVDTTASPAAVWRQYADVASWPSWKVGVAEASLDGPLRAGANGWLKPPDRDPMRFTILSAAENRGYTSETEVAPDVTLRIEHSMLPLPEGGARIIHRASVPRAVLDALGMEFGPVLYAGMQRTLEKLAAAAEGGPG